MKTTNKLRIYITIVCISFLQGLQFGPSPVLAAISEHYPNVSRSMVQMLITAPSLVGMFFALLCGVLVTKISKKKLLLAAAFVAFAVGMVPLFTDSFPVLFAMRTVYGFSLGLATALNTAVVAEWFTGDERVIAMGVQSASVGAGIAVITATAGRLGNVDFSKSYWINMVGAVCFVLILLCLPDTGKTESEGGKGARVNTQVFLIALLAFLENFFLISYTTNISMHIEGSFANSASVAGTLTSIFSVAQIVIGLLLGAVSKVTKKATMSVAMLSFALGAVLLVLFPQNLPLLGIGSFLCGFSQGCFIPTSMVEASNAVPASAAAMAAGIVSSANCLGQIVSPVVLNTVSKALFGSTSSRNTFILCAVGMTISAAAGFMIMNKKTVKAE